MLMHNFGETKSVMVFLILANYCKQLYLSLRTVPTNSKVFLRGLLTMREKQILTSVIEIQKENWG